MGKVNDSSRNHEDDRASWSEYYEIYEECLEECLIESYEYWAEQNEEFQNEEFWATNSPVNINNKEESSEYPGRDGCAERIIDSTSSHTDKKINSSKKKLRDCSFSHPTRGEKNLHDSKFSRVTERDEPFPHSTPRERASEKSERSTENNHSRTIGTDCKPHKHNVSLQCRSLPRFESPVVIDAFSFVPRSISEIKDHINEKFFDVMEWLRYKVESSESFSIFERSGKSVFQKLEIEDVSDNYQYWILGDVHGDVLAFETALRFAEAQSKKNRKEPYFILLGDLIDRFPFSFEVLFCLIERIKNGRRFLWLKGNHDFLSFNTTNSKFYTEVNPSDFCDWLNYEQSEGDYHLKAHLFTQTLIKIIDSLPYAVLFPDGVFLTHGGIPLADVRENIRTWKDLETPEIANDFVWKRMHPTKRQVFVNRVTKTSSVGYADYENFCNILEEELRVSIKAFIRGHDHYPERIKKYDKYTSSLVLTCNSMSCVLDGCLPIYTRFETPIGLIKYTPGQKYCLTGKVGLPKFEGFLLSIGEETVKRWYEKYLETSDTDEEITEIERHNICPDKNKQNTDECNYDYRYDLGCLASDTYPGAGY